MTYPGIPVVGVRKNVMNSTQEVQEFGCWGLSFHHKCSIMILSLSHPHSHLKLSHYCTHILILVLYITLTLSPHYHSKSHTLTLTLPTLLTQNLTHLHLVSLTLSLNYTSTFSEQFFVLCVCTCMWFIFWSHMSVRSSVCLPGAFLKKGQDLAWSFRTTGTNWRSRVFWDKSCSAENPQKVKIRCFWS